MSSPRCSRCGRFLSEPVHVIPVRDGVHPYTCDYEYLCSACSLKQGGSGS